MNQDEMMIDPETGEELHRDIRPIHVPRGEHYGGYAGVVLSGWDTECALA